jgi:gamma-glutamylcyclotransferase (GGCT)/AIG2-like uncharacterized protein YtfP
MVEINKDRPSILLAVYGTLRKNESNWAYLLKDKSKYLGTFRTEEKYRMYGRGAGFPIVSRKNGDKSIECDVFEITDNSVLQRIHQLEGCTGVTNHPKNWYNIVEQQTPFGVANIYVQDIEQDTEYEIPTGNWKDNY